MNLINELRMLAEDLHVNGYNRCSAAMSKAAGELDKWEAVFGHLGGTPDECGNAIVAARDELEERTRRLESALHSVSLCSQNSASSKGECGRIARAALTRSDENSSTSPGGRAAGPTASDLP